MLNNFYIQYLHNHAGVQYNKTSLQDEDHETKQPIRHRPPLLDAPCASWRSEVQTENFLFFLFLFLNALLVFLFLFSFLLHQCEVTLKNNYVICANIFFIYNSMDTSFHLGVSRFFEWISYFLSFK
jgi:hypothetical protein